MKTTSTLEGCSVIYPMIFSFTEHVTGKFLATITGCGRALMAKEDDGAWWMYGVEPGGLAESGETPQEAHLKFSTALKAVITDIAAEAAGCPEFEATIKELFHQVSEPDETVWKERAAAIRSGKLVPDSPFSALPKQPSETPRYISVQEIRTETVLPAAVSTFQQSLPTAA